MPELRSTPSLQDYQSYVKALEEERGFQDESVIDKCLLLGEEVGELFKSVRKESGIPIDETSKVSPVGEELADILLMVCTVANRMDVDLEAAFRAKEAKNAKRTWRSMTN